MEKNQYNLCLEVLNRLNTSGVLKEIILIGSWCLPFYSEYFSNVKYNPVFRTRDMDFLVPLPRKIKINIDIFDLLKDLGFIVGFQGKEGYIRLEHPALIIEFLVPEKGKGTNKPISLSQLGVNATALRFLNFLTDNTILVKVEDFNVRLPHPANFALHKLIIFQRRKNEEKAMKDFLSAIEILKALIAKKETGMIYKVFSSIPQKWQKNIIKRLEESKETEISRVLRNISL
ncbi:MAG TPA: GSU2403 family nucleotidyltransferase fold protein [Candidatus Omnitrophota bacterium]|nr:GSU2403 family nucleotidyltransferase fold protein [Candidatus Omnitrophota bacterium]